MCDNVEDQKEQVNNIVTTENVDKTDDTLETKSIIDTAVPPIIQDDQRSEDNRSEKDEPILEPAVSSEQPAVDAASNIKSEDSQMSTHLENGNPEPLDTSMECDNLESEESSSAPSQPLQMEMFETKQDDNGPRENISVSITNEESQSSIETHAEVVENNCYCGKGRNLNFVELQCVTCHKWFHESCISVTLGKCLPFMTYYTFFCKSCTPSGTESFAKKQPSFSQICVAALANLTHQASSGEQPKTLFSKDKDIIPYIEANWEYLTAMPRRIKQTWHGTVFKALMKDNLFVNEEAKDGMSNEQRLFGLANKDLSKICPGFDTIGKTSVQKQYQENSQSASGFSSGKGRGAKRKFFGEGQIAGAGKKIKSDFIIPKLPPSGYPLEHLFNKDEYQYILAEPDPHSPFQKEWDERQDCAGRPIPPWLFRKLTPEKVLLALHDRAPQLKVSEDRLTVTGEKGYCMVRGTHGVNRGTWYFEMAITDMPDGSATRIGWSQTFGNLQAPLGFDKFSYSWRSRKGTKFHESRGIHYADEGYGTGDVIGLLISLAPTSESIPLPPVFKDKPLFKFKGYLYYEVKDEIKEEQRKLKPLAGSKVVFYKNGTCIGTAFDDIYGGTYYPAASLYKSAKVTFNFGPNFSHPPDVKFRGMYETAHEAIIEQTVSDLLFFTENMGKLSIDN